MSTVAEIENALKKLPLKDARTVAAWLQSYLDEQWDAQLKRDIEAGKLEHLAKEAQAHYEARRTKPLVEVIDNP